jgi:hypothetical protein
MGQHERDPDAGPNERFRRAVRLAIEGSTLRAVAKEIGMSPSGLQNFLDGAASYGKTKEKLRFWYFRRSGFSSYAVEDAAYILRRLVSSLPAPDHGVIAVLDAVESSYQRVGMYPPDWVRLMRHELSAE